jgi:hypothetical protein
VTEAIWRKIVECTSAPYYLRIYLRYFGFVISPCGRRGSLVTEPIDYMFKRWDGFTSFLSDGRICLTNNAAEILVVRRL